MLRRIGWRGRSVKQKPPSIRLLSLSAPRLTSKRGYPVNGIFVRPVPPAKDYVIRFLTHSLLKNDDLCNVRNKAISRDVENAYRQNATRTHKMKIVVNSRDSTSCSRVWKIRNQDSGRFDSTFCQYSVKVCPRISKS